MNKKTYFLISGILFGLVCLVHVLTLLGGHAFVIGGAPLSGTFRWIAALITGLMSFSGLRLFLNSG